MKIVLLTFVMLIICTGAGRSLIPRSSAVLNPISTQIGYSYLLISFYLWFVASKNLLYAIILTLTPPLLGALYKALTTPLASLKNINKELFKRQIFLCISVIAIFALAVWPYVLNGFGNYWHGGNMDMEDGLFGRDAYIKGLIFNDPIGNLWSSFDQNGRNPSSGSPYFLWYAGDEIRLQYSNLAFWSYLLQITTGLDVVILNLLLNLTMMVMGCFLLVQKIFKLNNIQASITSVACAGSTFYLGTYWAGHIGSQMYVALFPAIFYLFFIQETIKNWLSIFITFVVLALAISFTYPQALIVGVGLILGAKIISSNFSLKLYEKIYRLKDLKLLRYSFITLLFILLIGFILWNKTELYRLQGMMSYRAWGVVHQSQILPIFLGLTSYPFSTFFNLTNPFWVYAGYISGLIILAAIFSYKGPHKIFLKAFLILWLLGLVFFYLFIYDSYYTYKYLYIHQFIIISGFCVAVFASKSRLLSAFALTIFTINLASDIGVGLSISRLETNRDALLYREILNFDKDKLSASFIDMGIAERMAVRQILKGNGIDPKTKLSDSEYVIVRSNSTGDITGEQLGEIVFQSSKVDIRRAPESNVLIFKTSFSEAEQSTNKIPFRWIKDSRDDNFELNVFKPSLANSHAPKFLRFCTEKGPSANGELILKVTDNAGKLLKLIQLGQKQCTWIPTADIVNSELPIIFKTGKAGVSLPFPEDRKLMYKISLIGWTNEINDPHSKEFIGN